MVATPEADAGSVGTVVKRDSQPQQVRLAKSSQVHPELGDDLVTVSTQDSPRPATDQCIAVVASSTVKAAEAPTNPPVAALASNKFPWRVRDLLWLVVWLVFGIFQGFAAVKTALIYPKILVDQFIFNNFVVLKMFVSAVGTSMLVQACYAITSPNSFAASQGRSKRRYGFPRVILGLSVLGIGMAVCGSGPTMVAPCLGGRVTSSWALLAGGCAGAFFVGLVDKLLARAKVSIRIDVPPLRKPSQVEGQLGALIPPPLVHQILGVRYSLAASVCGSFMIIAAVLLEVFIDFRKDLKPYGGPFAEEYPPSVFDWPAWPPVIAGISTGIAQVPFRIVSNMGLGGTGSTVTMVSTVFLGQVWPKRTIIHNCYQITHNYGWTLLGALLASFIGATNDLDQTTLPITEGFIEWRMAVGMFICMVGSLYAGGCTCGHGVTGISEFNLESWFGGGAIFAAAIATRCIIVFAMGIEN